MTFLLLAVIAAVVGLSWLAVEVLLAMLLWQAARLAGIDSDPDC